MKYQLEGAEILASKARHLLADEMGLGKTRQVVLAADMILARQILIIPPATGRFVWKAEFEKWSLWQDHDIHVMTTSTDEPKLGAVNIINFDLIARGFQKTSFQHNAFLKRLLAIAWDLIVVDEAHYLKEESALRTRAILGRNGFNGRAKRFWLLTGTPMPSHPGELWTILVSLGATTLEYKAFIERYCIVGKTGFSKGKPTAARKDTASELAQMLGSVMTRRYKQFVLPQLPEIRVDDMPLPEVEIKLSEFFDDTLEHGKELVKKIKEQEAFVQEVWKRAVASGGKMNMSNMVAVLEQIEAGVSLYRRWLGAMKATAFMPLLLDELENHAYPKIIIFAHHKQVIRFLKARLAAFNPVVIDGTVTSDKARKDAEHAFQTDPRVRVFIGSSSAREVITLTAAYEVVIVEPAWVPAWNAQWIMRAHRIGQRNAVRARMLRLAGTLDDYISDVLRRKTNDIVRIVDKGAPMPTAADPLS